MNNYDYFNGWNYVDGVGNYITLSSKENGIDEQQIQKIVDKTFDNTELKQDGQILQLSINGKDVSTVTIEDKYLHEVSFDENTKELIFKLNDSADEKRIDISDLFLTYATIEEINKKQDKLIAGKGIEITEDNVINIIPDNELFIIVDTLPENDILLNKIYLLPSSNKKNNDKFIEYAYVNNEWEIMGEVKADVSLDNYLTITEARNLYQPKGDYITEHQDISNLTTNEQLEEVQDNISNINEDLKKTVKYIDFDTNRKTIQLNNYDSISGIATNGTGHNLVMLSKWDVADFGAKGVHINLNGKEERPTYNDNKEIAFTDDIPSLPSFSDYVSKTELDNLKLFIKSVLSNNIDTVTTADNKTKTEGDLFVTGTYVGIGERTTYTATNGDINCYDLNISNSSLALIAKNGNIKVTELSTDGDCGNLRSISADGDGEILIKDCNLNESCYNGIQVNMDQALSDNVNIENIELHNVSNNGIIIFGTKESAVINLKNIYISEAKNAFRFSNRSNAQSVVVNMENINIDNVREKLFLFEDMKKVENKVTTDIFKNMTFNLKNVVLNGELITTETDKETIIQMVVGRPSQNEDIQVELTSETLPTFNIT